MLYNLLIINNIYIIIKKVIPLKKQLEELELEDFVCI